MAEGYRSQVGPRAGQPLPRVTAEDYGAGVADGIARFADTAYRAKKGEYLIDRRQRENAEWAEFQVRFAKEREAAATAAREARQKDDPEHSTRMAAHWQEAEERLLSGLSFDDLKGRARASVSSWGVQFRTGEADWQTVRSAEIATENFRDQRDAGANRVRRMDNAGDYAAELKIQREALDGMRISDEIRGKLWQETEQTFAVSFLQGRMDEDPVGAMALIESGAFDEVLTPAQVEALKNASAVEVRRAEAAAEREVAAAEREVREELEILTTREADGIDVAAEAAALRPRLEALGMEKELERLAGIEADATFARAYEGAPPAQLEQRLAAIEAKRKPSDAEQREAKWIRDKLPGITTRFTDDPVGFYAREGGESAPPPLDMSDPATVAARSRWARKHGVAEVLTRTEAASWAKTYGEGRQGEEAVMGLLASLPADQAMRAARMVDPSDDTLAVVVTLPDLYRNQARRGREALKADRKLLSDPMREDIELNEAVTSYSRQFDRALQAVPPDQRKAIHDTARQLAAGMVDKHGGTLTAELWRLSLNQAMGARGTGVNQRGGFGLWQGSWFLLPDGVTAREFGVAMRAKVAQGGPVNPDGSPANIGRAVPVAVGGGLYEFRTGGGRVLRDKAGQPWRVTWGRR
ncbi:hypothetical protein [uncultured Sphingopyxis sp.]|jgi:hypothetical protein|uniref:hypothetical protein n=1 Tax=uncultured Sphingopyxis sp. TaxID=310581 RepID=UPI002591867E|nr:hypothetical protein [uncultured Sphingopyxis sp.]